MQFCGQPNTACGVLQQAMFDEEHVTADLTFICRLSNASSVMTHTLQSLSSLLTSSATILQAQDQGCILTCTVPS